MGPVLVLLTILISCICVNSEINVCPLDVFTDTNVKPLLSSIVPALDGKTKGDAGKICVVGGSIEYTGAPYFAAITALRTGADLTYVITTESAGPVIKSYSPDLIVYPYLNTKSSLKLSNLVKKMDLLIIGPGLGREDDTIKLVSEIIKTCKELKKPLIIDADGLYIISKNPYIIKDYPSPGAILTPNQREAKRLMESVGQNPPSSWHKFWGEFVSVLVKGEHDNFYSSNSAFDWSSSLGGTGRRAAGQGDILAGSLGTIYNWAIKKQNICGTDHPVELAQSLSAFAAAKVTRSCNDRAYSLYGRSMLASDMIRHINDSFVRVFFK